MTPRFAALVVVLSLVGGLLAANDYPYVGEVKLTVQPPLEDVKGFGAQVTVFAANSIFATYMTSKELLTYYINPEKPDPFVSGVGASLPTSSKVGQPIAVTRLHAIAYTYGVDSSYYQLMAVTGEVHRLNRNGATARVGYSPRNRIAVVPMNGAGDPARAVRYLAAFNLSLAGQEGLLWNNSYGVAGDLVTDPIVYDLENNVIFAVGKVMYVVDIATGRALKSPFKDACGLATTANLTALTVVNIAKNEQGYPMDAFLTIADYAQHTEVCRISHRSGVVEWWHNFSTFATVLDLTGSKNNLFVSTELVRQSDQNTVTVLNAVKGTVLGSVARSELDYRNYPAVLPTPIGACAETVVLQVKGNLTAQCTEDLGTTKPPLWSVPVRCDHSAAVDQNDFAVFCIRRLATVHALDTDGRRLWTAPVASVHSPQIAAGFLLVPGADGKLYFLSLTGVAPSPAPSGGGGGGAAVNPPEQGLKKGVAAVLIILLFVVGVAVGVGASMYLRKSKRRTAYDAHESAPAATGGYGSLTEATD